MCSGAVALERRDALLRQEVAHRRIDVLVGAAHVVAAALEQRGQRRHRRAAHADQVNARGSLTTAASSMISLGRGVGHDARAHAERQRQRRAVGVPRRAGRTAPARESPPAARRRRRAPSDAPPGSSQRGISPKTTAEARAEQARSAAAASACDRCGTGRSPTSSRNSTSRRAESKAYGVPSDASSCVSVPPTSMPGGFAGAQRPRAADARSRRPARPRTDTRVNVSRS